MAVMMEGLDEEVEAQVRCEASGNDKVDIVFELNNSRKKLGNCRDRRLG